MRNLKITRENESVDFLENVTLSNRYDILESRLKESLK